jgi:hypothetical protein
MTDAQLWMDLMVKAYVAKPKSLFNTHDSRFKLTLTGNVTGARFKVSGPPPQAGGAYITVLGERLCDTALN